MGAGISTSSVQHGKSWEDMDDQEKQAFQQEMFYQDIIAQNPEAKAEWDAATDNAKGKAYQENRNFSDWSDYLETSQNEIAKKFIQTKGAENIKVPPLRNSNDPVTKTTVDKMGLVDMIGFAGMAAAFGMAGGALFPGAAAGGTGTTGSALTAGAESAGAAAVAESTATSTIGSIVDAVLTATKGYTKGKNILEMLGIDLDKFKLPSEEGAQGSAGSNGKVNGGSTQPGTVDVAAAEGGSDIPIVGFPTNDELPSEKEPPPQGNNELDLGLDFGSASQITRQQPRVVENELLKKKKYGLVMPKSLRNIKVRPGTTEQTVSTKGIV